VRFYDIQNPVSVSYHAKQMQMNNEVIAATCKHFQSMMWFSQFTMTVMTQYSVPEWAQVGLEFLLRLGAV